MVLGIGTDLIEVERVRELAAKGDAWLTGVFTPDEIAYCRSMHYPDRHFAARFAAKEAFLKALGTGWRAGIRFADVEIIRDSLGKPGLRITGKALQTLENYAAGAYRLHLSLSHLKSLATATVIIETGE